MEDKEMTSLREMLEDLSTPQLDAMLHGELSKENVDADAVRMIIEVLRRREADQPLEITPQIQEAWDKYRGTCEKQEAQARKARSRIVRAASMAAVVCVLILALPQAVGAENIFQMLWRWTDEIFEYFTPGAEDIHPEYVFETDHPGLQQVYDTVTSMGVADPMVPMWFPEEAVLVECKVEETRAKKGLSAGFEFGQSQIVFKVQVFNAETPHEYYKDETEITIYEANGHVYQIMRNDFRWAVTWAEGNVEYFLTLDCQEDMLYKIIDSI